MKRVLLALAAVALCLGMVSEGNASQRAFKWFRWQKALYTVSSGVPTYTGVTRDSDYVVTAVDLATDATTSYNLARDTTNAVYIGDALYHVARYNSAQPGGGVTALISDSLDAFTIGLQCLNESEYGEDIAGDDSTDVALQVSPNGVSWFFPDSVGAPATAVARLGLTAGDDFRRLDMSTVAYAYWTVYVRRPTIVSLTSVRNLVGINYVRLIVPKSIGAEAKRLRAWISYPSLRDLKPGEQGEWTN